MASPYDRVFADVRKDLPNVPDATVRQELFRVMDDFTQHTNIWQEEISVAIVPQVSTYDLTVTEGRINRLLAVWIATEPTKYWPMRGITMRVPGVLRLPIVPNNAASWTALVAKRTYDPVNPDNNYPVIDDWIVEKYSDPIGRGVLARLQLEPGKPWTSAVLAVANQKAYISGRSEARVNDGHGNVLDGQNWAFPQGWATVARKGWV